MSLIHLCSGGGRWWWYVSSITVVIVDLLKSNGRFRRDGIGRPPSLVLRLKIIGYLLTTSH